MDGVRVEEGWGVVDIITVCVWIIMGCVSCLYTEITWKFKREKIIKRMSDKSSPMVRDIAVNILDNRRYILILLTLALAPWFFLVTMWDVVKLIFGKSELQR